MAVVRVVSPGGGGGQGSGVLGGLVVFGVCGAAGVLG